MKLVCNFCMDERELTGLVRIPLLVLEQASELGLDRDELMRAAALDEAELEDPDARIPFSNVLKLWQAVDEHSGDPAIGLRIGRRVNAHQLGLVGCAMYYSRTLGEAYERFARYGRIISEAVQFGLTRADKRHKLVFNAHPSLKALHHPLNAQLAAVLAIGREITGTAFGPREINVPYHRPGNVADFRLVLGAPIRFDQQQASIIFDSKQLDLAVEAADPTVTGYLDELADRTLELLPDQSPLVLKIKRALWPQLSSGKASLRQTAAALGMSSRTLQRVLLEYGTSFSEVLDSFRRELTSELLANMQLPTQDIAFLLGYAEPSTFYRAFRRWTGTSPSQYRARKTGMQ